jgi:ribosomal protein L24E
MGLEVGKQGRKMFFFEKKNQKTFRIRGREPRRG